MKVSIAALVVLIASFARDSAEAFVSPQPLRVGGGRHAPPPPKQQSRLAPAVHHTPTQLQASLVDTQQLTTYFLEQVISSGVPALFTVMVIAFAASALRPKKDPNEELQFSNNPVAELYNDLYGNQQRPSSPFKFLPRPPGPTLLQNTGVPAQQYIKITNRNARLDSYQYSMDEATQSKALAASEARSRNFDKALQLGMTSSMSELSASQKGDLLKAEQEFLKGGSQLQSQIAKLQAQLTKSAIEDEMKSLGVATNDMDPAVNKTFIPQKAKFQMPPIMPTKDSKLFKEMAVLQENLMRLELAFIQTVVLILGPERANGVKAALLGDVSARGAGGLLSQLQDRPLTILVKEIEGGEERRKNVFVTQFPGDATASQVADLREEVTAIVRNSKPGDEALVVLQTGGGTVTGYGLAAAQLKRFKENGMKLTICVEQVAASGGYMMTCVADKIIASPFAVLGSIGVISDIPNVYQRLKSEGIEFQTITAGKYKRTITPTKKVAPEDIKKSKEEIEEILKLFKTFVKDNRPSLDIDKVATGETWFGTDALELKLCDEIKTADDVITEYIDADYNVFDVKYDPPPEKPEFAGLLPIGAESAGGNGLVSRAVRWLARTVAAEFKSEMQDLTASQRPDRKYMMQDDSSERIRAE